MPGKASYASELRPQIGTCAGCFPRRFLASSDRSGDLADGLLRRQDRGLALLDHVADRWALEPLVLEGRTQMTAVSARKTSVIHSAQSFGGCMPINEDQAPCETPTASRTAVQPEARCPKAPSSAHFLVPMAKGAERDRHDEGQEQEDDRRVHHDGVDLGPGDRHERCASRRRGIEERAGPDRRHRRAKSWD